MLTDLPDFDDFEYGRELNTPETIDPLMQDFLLSPRPNLSPTTNATNNFPDDLMVSPNVNQMSLIEFVEQFKQSQTRSEKQISELQAMCSQLLNENRFIKEAILKQQTTLESNQRLLEQVLSLNTLTRATSIRQQQSNVFGSSTSQSEKNTCSSRITERFSRPIQPNNCFDNRSSVSDESISDSNQEISMERINKDVSKNSSLPSRKPISMTITVESNDTQYTRTNDSIFNDQLSDVVPVGTNKISSQKSQEKARIAEGPSEINTSDVEDIPVLIHANDQNTLNSSKTKKKKQQKRLRKSVGPQGSRCLTTATPNFANIPYNESTKLCLLHPLNQKLEAKTDRYALLKDCFGAPSVLIMCGQKLTPNTILKMAMTSSFDSKFIVYGNYQLQSDVNNTEDLETNEKHSISYTVKLSDTETGRIELKGYKTQKICNEKPRRGKITLQSFPSDETNPFFTTEGATNFAKHNKFSRTRLSVCYQGEKNLTIFQSNILSSKQQEAQFLNISKQHPLGNTVSLNADNRTQIRLYIEIPEMFHCTLSSNYKWLEIAIINNNKLSNIYSIGASSNPYYIPINERKFPTEFEIIKRIPDEILSNSNAQSALQDSNATHKDEINSYLSKNGLNKFRIQSRVLHCERYPDQSSMNYDQIIKPWVSPEFTEIIESVNNCEQPSNVYETGTVESFGQKRLAEVFDTDCDYAAGLPVCKAARPSDYNCS